MDSIPNKLPANMALASDDQKEFNQKVLELNKKGRKCDGGVVYIGHIPHGFFEEQMKDYFSQFGTVKQLRIARSKKTGGIKGYAFVEFASEAVAKIVADTMNNYLMFHRLLKCQLMPDSKVHPDTFKGAGRRFKKPKAHLIAKDRHNCEKTDKQMKESERKMLKRKAKTSAKLAEMGINYDFTVNKNMKSLTKSNISSSGDHADIKVVYEDASSSDSEADEETKSPSAKRKKSTETTPVKSQQKNKPTKTKTTAKKAVKKQPAKQTKSQQKAKSKTKKSKKS